MSRRIGNEIKQDDHVVLGRGSATTSSWGIQNVNMPKKLVTCNWNFEISAEDYLEFKRISAYASNECCTNNLPMSIYLSEEANVNLVLRDALKRPDYDWAETFFTMLGNKIRIYRNADFSIVDPVLTYYKRPRYIEITGVLNPYTGVVSTIDVESEFKDDIVELILDETAAIIAGDIDNFNQAQREQQAAERSN